MKTDKWYRDRLNAYFNLHFWRYEDEIEWHVDPKPNMWRFDIPKFNKTVTLVCNDDGRIEEEEEHVQY